MVGVCGAIGGEFPLTEMAEDLQLTGAERVSAFVTDAVRLRGVTHDHRAGGGPGRVRDRDVLVWIWGNVPGIQEAGGYRPLDPDERDEDLADFCAGLYDKYGVDFVSRLNGDFVGVVYDREAARVSVFTDRLGTRPVFVTEAEDGTVVFSSHVQSLAAYPTVSLEFDEAYVVQHLTDTGGPYGVKTPLAGVESFPPGAIRTYDLESGTVRDRTYWRPHFEEVDRPFSAYLEEFVDLITASVRERTRDRSMDYGILMSGGSDARLILGALEDDLDLTAYHMADWMSKEARTAERVAMAKGIDFRFLRRDGGYFGRVADRSPATWNFKQLFNQAWAADFIDEIRAEVDVLLTGHFLDTMFKGLFVPTRRLEVGPLDLGLPIEREVPSLGRYVEDFAPEMPVTVDTDVDLREVLRANVSRVDGGIESYGVRFESLRDFVLGLFHYPATTDSFFRQNLREHVVLQLPVLDNRLIDLWMRMPVRYQLRRNIVGKAVDRLDPELGAMPHAHSGVPVRFEKLLHRLGYYPMNGLRRLSPFDAIPRSDVGHSPWGNHEALIRTRPYVEEILRESEGLVRALPFLDWERVWACYQDHCAGDDHTRELYRLVTLLEAPITARIAESGGGSSTVDATRPRDGRKGGAPQK